MTASPETPADKTQGWKMCEGLTVNIVLKMTQELNIKYLTK